MQKFLSSSAVFLLFVSPLVKCFEEGNLGSVQNFQLSFPEEDRNARLRRQESKFHYPDGLDLSFSAFDIEFNFKLEHFDVIASDAKVKVYTEIGIEEYAPSLKKTYRGVSDNSSIHATVIDSDRIHAIFMFNGELYQIDPKEEHFDVIPVHKRESMNDMVVFRVDKNEKPAQIGMCGVKSQTLVPSEDLEQLKKRSSTIPASMAAPAQWTNCHAYDNVATRIQVGFAADFGYFKKYGSAAAVQDKIQWIINDSNFIYLNQMNIVLTISEFIIMSTTGTYTWNQQPSCGMDISTDLSTFASWRSTYTSSKAGLWHLMTDCYPPPGTVGIAYVGVLCGTRSAVGVSTDSGSKTWQTVAHEIGHNFGAGHSFEEGQGNTGGIMDYGDGLYQGIYQFNTVYRKTEVCNTINGAIKSNPSCFTSYQPECGHGIVEGDEECDNESSCCVNCKIKAGATCSGGECCDSNCQLKPTTESCNGNSGFCSSEGCKVSECADGTYSNVGFCGMNPSNPCEIFCSISGSSSCVTPNRLQSSWQRYAPNGSKCVTSNLSGICQSGTCQTTGVTVPPTNPATNPPTTPPTSPPTQPPTSPPTQPPTSPPTQPPTSPPSNPTTPPTTEIYSWDFGGWGPCNAACDSTGFEEADIACIRQRDGQIVSDSFCNASQKPPSQRECQGLPCYSWSLSTQTSLCSELCGPGTTSKIIQCVTPELIAVSESLCDPEKRPSDSLAPQVPCFIQTCGNPLWKLEEQGSECNAPEESRGVITFEWYCFDEAQGIVGDEMCAERNDKPENHYVDCYKTSFSQLNQTKEKSTPVGLIVGLVLGFVLLITIGVIVGLAVFLVKSKPNAGRRLGRSLPLTNQ